MEYWWNKNLDDGIVGIIFLLHFQELKSNFFDDSFYTSLLLLCVWQDQLLFCDDCDRGYHMYCLNPPLSEPPEGKDIHISIIMYRARLKYKQMFYY